MVTPMASSPRAVEREEERGLNMRTLVIASAASASAAAVTSQLWIRGTWIAAAATPVIVAIVSELLHRPTNRIARAWTSDRPALPASRAAGETDKREPAEPGPSEPKERTPAEPGAGAAGPVRVYRQPPRRPSRRRIAWGVALGTAALAFVIGVTVLTATELIAGESIGKSDSRTTLVGGKSNKDRDDEGKEQAPADTTERTTPDREQDQDQTQPTTPEETATEQTTTPEETTTEQTTTPEQPAPRNQPPAGEPEASP
jgi:hypothetical protein